MEDVEDPIDDEFDEPLDGDAEEAVEVADADPARPATEPADVESLENLIAKKDTEASEEDDDPLMALGREERLEPLAEKVIPPQATEFVCKRCFLVKHQSQLKDKKRTLCRDCA